MTGKRKRIVAFAFLSSLHACRLFLCSFVALGVVVTGAATAAPPCKLVAHPNFDHIPMRIAVVSDSNSAELEAVVSEINDKQDHYELAVLPKGDSSVHLTLEEDYDGILVFDRMMMFGGLPKYNRYLFTYRNKDLADETMIVDFQFDKDGRVSVPFIQVAAANADRQKLLMEIGLMALASPGLMQNKDFVDYYFKVDGVVTDEARVRSSTELEEVFAMRERIVVGCFLTGK